MSVRFLSGLDYPDTMSSSSIRIRPAVSTDVPTILHFIRGLAKYERLLHEVEATEEKLEATLFGETPFAEVLLAEEVDSGQAVGFALFFYNYSTFLAKPGIHLEDLFVLEDRRGRGTGRALLKRLAEITVARDCGRLEWAVLDWNEPAIEFYRALGAKPMDEWTTFRLTGDALRDLAAS